MSSLTDEDALRRLVDDAAKINEANKRHYEEHSDELQEQYGGQIVVIADRQVVDSRDFTADLTELTAYFDELREEHGEETVEEAYVAHVPEPDEFLLL